MTLVPFRDAEDIGDRFLELLSRLGIQPPLGSDLESELLSLAELIEVMRNPSLSRGPKQLEVLRAAAGLHDLAAKVLSVEPLPDFAALIPHLRLIAETKMRAASVGQIATSGIFDDTARKMAELYVGCLSAHTGVELELDSPTKSKGDNPDIIFKVEECQLVHRPQRWALAIKTVATLQGQTIFERIEEGANQIDDPKCPAERGMVVINAKNALDHDSLWNQEFSSLASATAALRNQLSQLANNAAAERPQDEWDALFEQKVARPVLFLGQSVVRLSTQAGAHTPTALKMLLAHGANGVLDPVGEGLGRLMNHFMQTVLLGIPGGPDHLPQ